MTYRYVLTYAWAMTTTINGRDYTVERVPGSDSLILDSGRKTYIATNKARTDGRYVVVPIGRGHALGVFTGAELGI